MALLLGLALAGLVPLGCGGRSSVPVSDSPAGTAVPPKVLHRELEGRSFRLFSPSGSPAGVVLALHPLHGSADSFATTTRFDDVARPRGWLVVYPDAPAGEWNAGFCCPFGSAPQRDDAGYLMRLLGSLDADPRTTFVAGFSNGGMMAYRLACEFPDRIAAIFVDAADSPECSPSPPLPAILHEQGTADQESGNRVWGLRSGRWVNTEPSAVKRWSRLGAHATLVTVSGGGHVWFPDATRRAAAFFDSVARDR